MPNYIPEFQGYSGQGAFRYWCQKVLPLVYDDSLSYYELLNKIVVYLNNTIEDVAKAEGNIDSLLTAYTQLQNYVNNYFDSLDVQEEINHKLDEMAKPGGGLSALIDPYIHSLVTDWLTENVIIPEGGAVTLDPTLTSAVQAAPAKTVGDKITDLDNMYINKNLSFAGFRVAGGGTGTLTEITVNDNPDTTITTGYNIARASTDEGNYGLKSKNAFKLIAGETYELSAWVKGGEDFAFVVGSLSAGSRFIRHYTTTSDWKKYTYRFTVNTTESLYCYVYNNVLDTELDVCGIKFTLFEPVQEIESLIYTNYWSPVWEQGTIGTATGGNVPSLNRVRTNGYKNFETTDNMITITMPTDWKLSYREYSDTSATGFIRTVGWITETSTIQINSDCYYRFVLGKDDDSDIDIDDAYESGFSISYNSIKEQKPIKVLCIGNSHTNNGIEYLAQILSDNGYDPIVANYYWGSATLAQQYTALNTNSGWDGSYSRIYSNTGRHQNRSATLNDLVLAYEWDWVIFQQATQDSGDYTSYVSASFDINSFITLLKQKINNENIKFGIVAPFARASDAPAIGGIPNNVLGNNIQTVTKQVAEHMSQCDCIVNTGLAVKYARNNEYLNAIGDEMTIDNHHLDVGIPRYMSSMVYAMNIIGTTAGDKSIFMSEDLSKRILGYLATQCAKWATDGVSGLIDTKNNVVDSVDLFASGAKLESAILSSIQSSKIRIQHSNLQGYTSADNFPNNRIISLRSDITDSDIANLPVYGEAAIIITFAYNPNTQNQFNGQLYIGENTFATRNLIATNGWSNWKVKANFTAITELESEILKNIVSNLTNYATEHNNSLTNTANENVILLAEPNKWTDTPTGNSGAFINKYFSANQAEQIFIETVSRKMFTRIVLRNQTIKRNYMPANYYDGLLKTTNGITFTVNSDGSITANGTATANANFFMSYDVEKIPEGEYILSGCPEGGSNSTYRLRVANGSSSVLASDEGNNANLTITNELSEIGLRMYCTVISGTTANNLTFYPMIRLSSVADRTYYKPQAETNVVYGEGWVGYALETDSVQSSQLRLQHSNLGGYTDANNFPDNSIISLRANITSTDIANLPVYGETAMIVTFAYDPNATNKFNTQIYIGVNTFATRNLIGDNGWSNWSIKSDIKARSIFTVGDSICQAYRNDRQGFIGALNLDWTNKSVIGACLSNYRVDVSDPTTQTGCIYYQFINWMTANPTYSPDIVLGEGGINDYRLDVALGNIPTKPVVNDTEAGLLDKSTLLGGLEYLFYNMIKYLPKAQRFFLVTHRDKNYPWTKNYTGGYTQTEMVDAISKVCKLYGVYLIDVFNESMINTALSQYVSPTPYADDHSVTNTQFVDSDGTHPLNLGYLEGYVPLVRKALQIGTHKE